MNKETLQEIIFSQLIDNAFGDYVQDDVIVLDDTASKSEELDECIVTC